MEAQTCSEHESEGAGRLRKIHTAGEARETSKHSAEAGTPQERKDVSQHSADVGRSDVLTGDLGRPIGRIQVHAWERPRSFARERSGP